MCLSSDLLGQQTRIVRKRSVLLLCYCVVFNAYAKSWHPMQGEFEHKVVKRRYAHTNRRNFIPQLVKKDVIENVHERMAEELEQASKESDKWCGDFHAPAETETAKRERQQVADEGHVHHRIATDEMVRIHVRTWAECPEIQGDPAYKVHVCIVYTLA